MHRRTLLKIIPVATTAALARHAPTFAQDALQTRIVVVEGNSLSCFTPTNLYDTPVCWPSLMASGTFAAQHNIKVVNVAVGSTGTREAFARAPLHVDPLRPLADWGCVVFIEGGNDVAQVTGDGYNSYLRARQYCLDRRAAGWLVIIGTITNRTSLPFDTWWWESLQYNSYVRQYWREFADGLVDLASTQELGATGAADNPLYFRDKIHYAAAGYEMVRQMVESELAKLLPQVTVQQSRPQTCLAFPLVNR